jgi:hypothetical protein
LAPSGPGQESGFNPANSPFDFKTSILKEATQVFTGFKFPVSDFGIVVQKFADPKKISSQRIHFGAQMGLYIIHFPPFSD